MTVENIVIVGAGMAGVSAAQQLRESDFEGSITLIGDDPEFPYDRPPLSKQVLTGEMTRDDILLQPESWYEENKIDTRFGKSATAIDIQNRRVTLDDGSALTYDKLLLATGSRVRRLAMADDSGIPTYYVRTLADGNALKAACEKKANMVVIGGGVIGMETAATAVSQGCNVTVLEAASRLMERFFPPEMSTFLNDYHAEQGVNIHYGVSVESIADGKVTLSDGRIFPADILVVGIGVIPNSDLAEQAGLEVGNGIVVDQFGQTSDPDVYAVGDVAFQYNLLKGEHLRQENWLNAQVQGQNAAKAMLGEPVSEIQIPWIWTDQYKLNIQINGFTIADEHVVRGDMKSGKFTLFHLQDGVVVGGTTINDGKSKKPLQKMIAARAEVAPEALADTEVNLKKLDF